MDAFFVRQDRGSAYQHTLKIVILDPSSDPDGWSFEAYREILEHQLPVATLLRKRYLPTPLGLHQPVWVDDPDFDLDSHLRRVVCPSPGDMRAFCKLVERVYPDLLDHGRPLWRLWVVEGLEGGRVATVMLLHHAYADGAGVRGILESISSTAPVAAPSGEVPDWRPRQLPSAPRRLLWAARDLPQLARSVPATVAAVRKRRRLEQALPPGRQKAMPSAADCRGPQPFGGVLARSRRFACRSFSLAELKQVGRALGGTVNDVFLSCVAGSVREFLVTRGSSCESPTICTMPFLAKPLEERSAPGGNFSSAGYVWLHIEIADPVRRLAATRESAQATKEHVRAVADADPLLVVSDLIPSGAMRALGRLDERTDGRFTPGANIAVSNASGPREPRYLGRWRIEHWFSTGQVMHGATLNITGWSYAGQFNVCVFVGSPALPDAWELMDGFRSAYEELLAIARAEVEDKPAVSGARDEPTQPA